MLNLITGPANYALTLEEAKEHLVITYDTDDDLIIRAIEAATSEIDGEKGWLGRALITQTWELRLPEFPGSIELPLPPYQSISQITYIDTDGDSQTLASNQYTVTTLTDTKPSIVEPAYDSNNARVSWPGTRSQKDAVKVRFVCGYGDDTSDIPDMIRWWLKIRVATMYEHREQGIVGTNISEVPFMAHMLENYRVR